MSTVPPQIQSTTNLGPSAPHPDWPLPASLTIAALLILILAIGLVTVSPQDLLTAEKGGTCLFLGEDCCYFVNETGIVQDTVRELKDRIEHRKKELQNLYTPPNLFQQILPWLLPFLGPMVLIILFLLFGPCLFNLFQRFLQEQIRAISRDQVKTILLESLTSSSEKGDCGP